MLPCIPANLVGPLLVASSHGLADLRRPPSALASYALVPLLPDPWVTPLFAVASVRHFSHDVVPFTSLLLHVLWILLVRLGQPDVAWCIFCVFYLFVHSLSRFRTWWRESKKEVCLAVGATAAASLCLTGDLVLQDWMKRVVIAHVVVDELHSK